MEVYALLFSFLVALSLIPRGTPDARNGGNSRAEWSRLRGGVRRAAGEIAARKKKGEREGQVEGGNTKKRHFKLAATSSQQATRARDLLGRCVCVCVCV